AEVDDLRVAPLLARHLVERRFEDFGSRMAMDVLGARERLEEARVAREVRHDAKLDLRVIRRHDLRARRRDESLADAASLGRAYGNVLEGRVEGGEAPGDRRGLRIRGVHAAGPGVHHARQLVGVGALELGEPAMLEEHAADRVVFGELLEDFLVRRGNARGRLLDDLELETLEENVAELLGGAEVEGAAPELMGLLLQLEHLLAEGVAL